MDGVRRPCPRVPHPESVRDRPSKGGEDSTREGNRDWEEDSARAPFFGFLGTLSQGSRTTCPERPGLSQGVRREWVHRLFTLFFNRSKEAGRLPMARETRTARYLRPAKTGRKKARPGVALENNHQRRSAPKQSALVHEYLLTYLSFCQPAPVPLQNKVGGGS
jgi:hypothetical protein